MKKLFLLVFLFSIQLYATDISFKFGAGFGQFDQDGPAETKYISLGIINDISRIFKTKIDFGAWFDSLDVDKVKRSSGFGSGSFGLRVNPGYFYTETFWGISYITQTDIQLGMHFEFTEEVGIGVQDGTGKYMGIEYRHFSNAGISEHNLGRDFCLVTVGVPL